MNIFLHFHTGFDAVFLMNGVFLDKADSVRYDEASALYVTVLPLKAMYLPYTVKLVSGKPVTNTDLAVSYALPDKHFYIKLKPRCNYVYTAEEKSTEPDTDTVPQRFFSAVKDKNAEIARRYLTRPLNESIDDASLLEFFDGFADIVPNNFSPSEPSSYYLIDKDGGAHLYNFHMHGSLIENITEE